MPRHRSARKIRKKFSPGKPQYIVVGAVAFGPYGGKGDCVCGRLLISLDFGGH